MQGQGQQPILNDALSYLDQVKVQFADHPDVYNRFLDIMKDFKSGAIDTPGVIGRVSTLFAGNPELIQGFNTFLPPGYRIECGAGDDPNAIRVTTPMGTTVQSMPQPRPLSRQDGMDGLRPANGTFTPQPGAQSAQMMFSPSGRPLGPATAGQPQHLFPLDPARQQEQQALQAQQERGVNSLQIAVSAATSGGALRAGVSPRATPMPGQDVSMLSADVQGQAGMEKRPPVEFNHAISYVNKIKVSLSPRSCIDMCRHVRDFGAHLLTSHSQTRFHTQPDIYKQFLEILQTYQRESKPIQDVYSQVTHLFKTAPDLLEDFKQFLPESAAAAKAHERARQAEESAMLSNVRGEGGLYASPVMSREAQMGTPSRGQGLPPIGNFAPTPISKDNKRKRGERQGTADRDGMAGPSGGKVPFATQPGNKRPRQTQTITKASDQPPASPSLVPTLPTPMPPTTTSAATNEELSFFDRAKKIISNKNIMNEFLKLCNLFSQDLIDRSTLVHRARAFIGGSPELMKYFETFVGYDERDIVIENRARIPSGRVSLSNCRGLGPSYRLLPKRERQKPCSGRDELCNAVLNDEWASHPTWASEDSGFIAHRKNVHEEGLHRIEEERHDYDYNIEACARTIQLLEPIAQQLRRLSDAEQQAYKLPPGLGGQSETIYKRVIMKLYGREKGHDVVTRLHAEPYQVIPVLLNRLKERLETWKMAQREWEKVWREQTQKMFWRSLDHQAVAGGKSDKRQFQTKALQSEIAVRHEEMRRMENVVRGTMKNPQMEFTVDDMDVVLDATYLVLQHVHSSLETDQPRLGSFIKEFIPLFFGLDAEVFNAQLRAKLGDTPPNEVEEPLSGTDDSTKPRKGNGKPGNLLRTALDRGRGMKTGRKDREDSNASASRASTPDVASNADDEMVVDAPERPAETKTEQPIQRWFEHPDDGNSLGSKDIDPNEPQKRETYRLWSSTAIYCFVRMFIILYERLLKLKRAEPAAREAIRNALKPKPAIDLGIIDKLPQDFFEDTGKDANYYKQMLAKLDDVLRGDLDFAEVEDTLRRFYLQSGYGLYAFEKMGMALARFAVQALNGEGKEKSWEIYSLFKKDRVKETTTKTQQIDYRKAVEKMIKDGDLYKIDYVSSLPNSRSMFSTDPLTRQQDQSKQKIELYLAKKDDASYYDDELSPMDLENHWRTYIATYETVDDTDGIKPSQLHVPFLFRNVREAGANPKSTSYPPSPPPQTGEGETAQGGQSGERIMHRFLAAKNEENLVIRVAVGSFKAHFQPNTQEGWFEPTPEREGSKDGVWEAEQDVQYRDESMRDTFVMNHLGMKDLSKDQVEKKNEGWRVLSENGEVREADGEGEGEQMEVDD